MMKRLFRLITVLVFHFVASPVLPVFCQSHLPAPRDHFGFVPGTDRMLFSYGQLVEYLFMLDQASPMLKMVEIGTSPMGKPMYIAFISSAENIARLDELKDINRKLALEPGLTPDERKDLLSRGRVFFLATLSMHSTEVAPSQAAPLIAYQLLTTTDPLLKKYLEDVVYMMVPNHNPDGMDLVVENYNRYKGTKYEGASLPGVYHKYIGHDNNRDFVILSQEDTRAISRIFSTDWFPQVMIEKHQMGSTGIRYFVPPMHDPIAENVDAGLWTWTGVFGTNMLRDMTNEGLAGIGQKTIFDDYWPGSTETCLWKGVIGMLTEAASVKDATPLFIEPAELSVRGKGLSEYKKSINFPMPWEGGWWRLGDIVRYEIESTLSIIKTSSLHREDILSFRNDLCRREVERGRTSAPCYFVLPSAQDDRHEWIRLILLMKEHGVQVYKLGEDHTLDNRILKKDDLVIPLAQPFRAFIKEVMEVQEFPVRHYTPGGEIIRPYDVASWSLPLHRGLVSWEIKNRDLDFEKKLILIGNLEDPPAGLSSPVIFPVTGNGSFLAAFMALTNGMKVERTTEDLSLAGKNYPTGSFILRGKNQDLLREIISASNLVPGNLDKKTTVNAKELKMPRIALVETWFHDMDAGWTRYVLDTYHIPFTVIRPDAFEKTDLVKNFDMVIFPSESKSLLLAGKYGTEGSYTQGNYHPDYQKGMGKKGLDKLMQFVDQGGKVLSWGESVDLFTGMLEITNGEKKEEFNLPFTNLADQFRKDGLYIPGSLVRVMITPGHPLTLGMKPETGVFYRGATVFSTSIPRFDMDRRVIARFPEKDILLSGYAEKEESLAGKTAMIWLKKGRGQMVLYAFSPQFRASTQASYKLLFNAILLPDAN